jgi:SWI/SNF-related matrix-associated actin-dependent regulator 1 of chromatin subfamily A
MNLAVSKPTTEIVQKEKKKIGQLQKKCPVCNKTAVETKILHMPNGIIWIKLECGHLVKKDAILGSDYKEYGSIDGALKAFNYQIEGLDFIVRNNGRVLIADEPGLGKTIQGIGFVRYYSSIATPCLWVCKSSLTLQATKEFLIWAGIEFFPQVITSAKNFIMPGMKVYVISMDLLRRMPREKLEAMKIKCVIADEVQHFKNPDSTRTAELRQLVNSADFFIALSGTPWKNRGSEYFTILNMLAPERFPSKQKFINDWIEYVYDSKTGKMREAGIRNIEKFREYTKDIVIRRMRDDVLPDLPKINRQVRFVDMDKYKDVYDKEEGKVANAIKDALLEGGNVANLAAEIMRLKHITGVAKAIPCIEDAIEFLDNTDEEKKLTIFYHHVDVGNILEDGDPADKTLIGLNKWLIDNGYNKCLRLSGETNNRQDVVDAFRTNPRNRVLLASALAAGEGLNLQFCQDAFMLERQWNPANEEQCELRFSRPGSTAQSIRIPYFIAADTIDEMLTDIVEKKRVAFNRTMNVGSEELKFEESDIIRELAEAIVRKKFAKK